MAVTRTSTRHSSKGAKKSGGTGSRAIAETAELDEEMVVNIRLPRSVVEKVDSVVRRRRVRIPRHSWLLEAVYAHLDEEERAEELREAENELLAIREGRSRTYQLEEVMRAHGNLEG